jgi:hypothetical protein
MSWSFLFCHRMYEMKRTKNQMDYKSCLSGFRIANPEEPVCGTQTITNFSIIPAHKLLTHVYKNTLFLQLFFQK